MFAGSSESMITLRNGTALKDLLLKLNFVQGAEVGVDLPTISVEYFRRVNIISKIKGGLPSLNKHY